MLLLMMLAAGLAVPASAQGPGPARMQERLQAHTDTLFARLDLTELQAPTVRAILDAHTEKRLALFEERRGQGDRAAMRRAFEALDAETETQLADVLTEAQLETYHTVRAEQRAARRGPRRGPRRNR